MNRLNRISFLQPLTHVSLFLIGFVLWALPGSFPVVFRCDVTRRRGESACLRLEVVRHETDTVKRVVRRAKGSGGLL